MGGKDPLSDISGIRISEVQAAARHAAIASTITGGSTEARRFVRGRRSLATAPIELKILLDMDGVLCDFIGGYFKRNSHIPMPNPWPAGVWDLRVAMPGIEFSMELPKAFWSDLDWMPDGQLILSTLTEEVGGENICILSSCDVPNVGAACTGKMEWMQKHTPQFGKRYLFGPDKRFCAHTGAVLIDDKDENVDNFRADGGHAILVPRLWNSSHHRTNVPIDAYIRAQLDMIRDTTQLDSR